MKNQGKMFRQHCESIETEQQLKYTKAVHDEGLSLAVEIAAEIAYRDNVIKRKSEIIQNLRIQLDETMAELESYEDEPELYLNGADNEPKN